MFLRNTCVLSLFFFFSHPPGSIFSRHSNIAFFVCVSLTSGCSTWLTGFGSKAFFCFSLHDKVGGGREYCIIIRSGASLLCTGFFYFFGVELFLLGSADKASSQLCGVGFDTSTLFYVLVPKPTIT